MGRNITIRIEQDTDAMAPWNPDFADGQWTLHLFGRNFCKPVGAERDEYISTTGGWSTPAKDRREYPATIGLRRKLTTGLAWWIQHFDYGSGGERIYLDCDIERANGILLWEHKPSDMGAKTVDERKQDAQCYVTECNQYFEGDVYGVIVDETDYPAEYHDSCWGFYGIDAVMSFIGECGLTVEDNITVEPDGMIIDEDTVYRMLAKQSAA
jgi:hypothetical protein